MIKEKGRVVEQGPGEILGGGESAVGGLLGGHGDVPAKAQQDRILNDGLLGFGEPSLQRL